VDLHVCLRHRAHPASSSSCLRSASADTRCSVYLSIHRSWIRRMGTGLRKCNFERPTRCVVTSPASSRTRRCFITPKRDISNTRPISPSDWPSRSKRPSRIARRVGSASARKTASSMGSRTGDPSVTLPMVSLYVTRGSHVKPFSVHAVSELLEDDVAADPLEQFRRWFAEADEDNPMALATGAPDGAPSVRMVLLKGVDDQGFVFFTGYESRTGGELQANGRAPLLFHWAPLGRQVRIEGPVERVAADESDAYFATRPRGAQLAAAASRQGRTLANRTELDEAVAELER